MRVCQQLLCIFHIRGLEELVDEVFDLRNVLESVPNYKNIYIRVLYVVAMPYLLSTLLEMVEEYREYLLCTLDDT